MKILGVSAFYHDSAAALISDDSGQLEIIAAAQEERFSRKKFDEKFPVHAIRFCLEKANVEITDLDAVVFYDKPWITFERLLETYLQKAPQGLLSFLAAMPTWLGWKLNLRKTLQKEFKRYFLKQGKDLPPLLFSSHHLSHAASAYFPSTFSQAAILCMDGVGEWETTTLWKAEGSVLKQLLKIEFPHSLGLLYSAFTFFCGFKVNSGEYKLMGLAPFGQPVFRDKILTHLIRIKDDGSFILNLKYFDYLTGFAMTSKSFSTLFGCEPRNPDDPIRQVDMDMAASIQEVTEVIVVKLAQTLKKLTGSENLCLAGGVALNCVANGNLVLKKIFDHLWIQPAAGDAGGALGAALAAYHIHFKNERKTNEIDLMAGALLGTEYSDTQIKQALERRGIEYQKFESPMLALSQAAQLIAQEKVVGIFQGRMEYGPRALGSRSIVGDARVADMQKRMNLKIKFRESFRPFAPAVLSEFQQAVFDLDCDSPYMLLTAQVRKELIKSDQQQFNGLSQINQIRSVYPAITHVDYSARVQSVIKGQNKYFHHLISEFKNETNSPVVINTSFNVRGEPIVESPDQALDCFINTDIDAVCMGSFLIAKSQQSVSLKRDLQWSEKFEKD